MTETADLRARLRDRGVVITVVPGPPDRLNCHAPKGAITPDLRDQLLAHKDGLLALLKSEAAIPDASVSSAPAVAASLPCYCCGTTRFWSGGHDHWICGTCHPPAPGVLRDGVQWRDGRPHSDRR